MTAFLLVVLAYLAGSITTAVLVCRLLGLPDPRTLGSGNPGATNVLRIGGKRAAACTLAGDALKGLLPLLLARAIDPASLTLALCALAAFLGHLYPVFFGFRGGKGVATALGALLGLNGWLALSAMAVWGALFAARRISSLAALGAAAATPFCAWALGLPPVELLAVAVMVVLLLLRHRDNIVRLYRGEEHGVRRTDQTDDAGSPS